MFKLKNILRNKFIENHLTLYEKVFINFNTIRSSDDFWSSYDLEEVYAISTSLLDLSSTILFTRNINNAKYLKKKFNFFKIKTKMLYIGDNDDKTQVYYFVKE